ncbi:hypothetical protein B0H16DRAFT_1726414 [Mycena metata]|uniref:Uncharacterized protein n=1 Tax=Mycena metata TaxID=1033252 RepID=A0AAD7N5R3_9AGAR|nr:hypothetical protein B0H16DRAFT_1726414 [Mycena metata]
MDTPAIEIVPNTGSHVETATTRSGQTSAEREGDPTPDRVMQRGMERGYAMSEMVDLHREFHEDQEMDTSVAVRTNLLASKNTLDREDIIDRGVALLNARTGKRFALESGFFLRTERTINEMQYLLERAADLVDGRTNRFQIDPFKSLSKVLRNANDLNELHVAWLALSTRMGLALRNLDKYESEYAAIKESDVLLSPLSTNPEVYEVFPRNRSDISDVNYLYNHVPHLQELCPTMYDSKVEWLPDKLQAPAYLARAFPHRSPEERPAVVSYTQEGERREIALPLTTSRGLGAGFRPPPLETERSRRASKEDDTQEVAPRVGTPSLDVHINLPAGWNPATAKPGLMSAYTAYKDPNLFFVPKSPRDETRHHVSIPGPNLPNPILGMASTPPVDSISQASPRANLDAPFINRPSTPRPRMVLEKVREVDEGMNARLGGTTVLTIRTSMALLRRVSLAGRTPRHPSLRRRQAPREAILQTIRAIRMDLLVNTPDIRPLLVDVADRVLVVTGLHLRLRILLAEEAAAAVTVAVGVTTAVEDTLAGEGINLSPTSLLALRAVEVRFSLNGVAVAIASVVFLHEPSQGDGYGQE